VRSMSDARSIIRKACSEGRTKLLEHEALDLLEAYGIPKPPHAFVNSAAEAVNAARRIGFPIALKVVSPDILHKSDVGGVVLGLQSGDEVEQGFNELMNNVKAKAPYARVAGVLVQWMVPNGLETIIGATRDDMFGGVIAFGLGGVFTEVLRDVSLRVSPIGEDDARAMIRETRASILLNGFRGMSKRDSEALVAALVKFSLLIDENEEIVEADLNPVIALEEGRGAYAADARFVLKC